jgi:hypothetical protein
MKASTKTPLRSARLKLKRVEGNDIVTASFVSCRYLKMNQAQEHPAFSELSKTGKV